MLCSKSAIEARANGADYNQVCVLQLLTLLVGTKFQSDSYEIECEHLVKSLEFHVS